MLKNKLKSTRNKLLVIAAPVILALALVGLFLPAQNVDIEGTGSLCVETRIALAASSGGTLGNGEPVPQEIISPTFALGGPPVISITYNFNAVLDTDDILTIDNTELSDIHVGKAKAKAKAKGKGQIETPDEVALRIKSEDVQPNYEIWTLLSDFPTDDPARNGQLLVNERIEKIKSVEYLVTTLAYFDIHIYSLDPLRFVTKINGLDAGPVTGEWWL